jgi:hypothetical protein
VSRRAAVLAAVVAAGGAGGGMARGALKTFPVASQEVLTPPKEVRLVYDG